MSFSKSGLKDLICVKIYISQLWWFTILAVLGQSDPQNVLNAKQNDWILCLEVQRRQHNCIQHWRRWPRHTHNDCQHRWYILSQNFHDIFKKKNPLRRRCGLASVQEEDKWGVERGAPPREKSQLRLLKNLSFHNCLIFSLFTHFLALYSIFIYLYWSLSSYLFWWKSKKILWPEFQQQKNALPPIKCYAIQPSTVSITIVGKLFWINTCVKILYWRGG